MHYAERSEETLFFLGRDPSKVFSTFKNDSVCIGRGTNLPSTVQSLEKLVTLQSHILVSFQQITLTLGNLANFKALFLTDFH